MTWADFYLVCIAVGFLLSAISFIAGGLHWHVHIPHFPFFNGNIHVGHGPMPHGPVVNGHVGNGGAKGGGVEVSPFNFITLTAFMAWFGGTGFLISRYSSVWFALGLLLSTIAGLIGAAIVFLFLTKVLISPEENMDAADYEMVGVLGRTSLPIREGGTGEIIYSQAGTRRTCGARSEDGNAIEKGTEIVVTRYHKGIAYVRRWEEMSGEQ
jgi:membrane protein implicated in regulation of membrane protease activity